MSKHKHRHYQPVTRREVLRIVQRAREDIIRAVVMAASDETPARQREQRAADWKRPYRMADVDAAEDAG